jgi:CP family cyanate transporter-like MFS transporter
VNNREAIEKSLPIFITAINMRSGLSIMSPLIPILKEQYQLSSFALSFITSLSIMCFAGSAFLMPLVAKIGSTNRVIGASLAILTMAMIIRAVGNLPLIYFSSFAMGVSVAVLNFSLPVWVKENVTNHSGLVTGIYITIMGVFANIAIAVTVPLATSTSWGWRLSTVPWIVIGVFSSVWWLWRNSKLPRKTYVPEPAKFHKALLRKSGAWSIALFFGFQAMMGYGALTWMPTILVSKGFSLSEAGLWISISGFAGSALGVAAPYYGSKLKNFRILLTVIAITLTISFIAFTLDSGWHLVVWLFISNFAFAFAFPLCLVLTVTRSVEAAETRSLSIMTQSVGYLMAAISPGIVAVIFDISNSWNTAWLFLIGIGVVLIGVGYKAGSPEKIII